jgi:hypothetical protein
MISWAVAAWAAAAEAAGVEEDAAAGAAVLEGAAAVAVAECAAGVEEAAACAPAEAAAVLGRPSVARRQCPGRLGVAIARPAEISPAAGIVLVEQAVSRLGIFPRPAIVPPAAAIVRMPATLPGIGRAAATAQDLTAGRALANWISFSIFRAQEAARDQAQGLRIGLAPQSAERSLAVRLHNSCTTVLRVAIRLAADDLVT